VVEPVAGPPPAAQAAPVAKAAEPVVPPVRRVMPAMPAEVAAPHAKVGKKPVAGKPVAIAKKDKSGKDKAGVKTAVGAVQPSALGAQAVPPPGAAPIVHKGGCGKGQAVDAKSGKCAHASVHGKARSAKTVVAKKPVTAAATLVTAPAQAAAAKTE
jgi:hypothetical protein